ncbi:hypothetical protein SAMN05216302_101845 [Nitrosomonas aestuarii]|uniref:Virulence plasmid A protein n=1 Tax=Nitrosomonas aestuarii TaxID=52441 RepID=A0A1I4D2H4_9PROT|nr:neuraminidase-like domain-containing protein [Nitrosomonas aestuarii]SFK87173.1 hypothetical protein SAMN05216302_101845 [Nitrosomonas aestuarii]
MARIQFGEGYAWFGEKDTPAPQNFASSPSPTLTVGVSAKYSGASVYVRYRRVGTSWRKLEVRKSNKSKSAQYFTAQFPRFDSGNQIEYEVSIKSSGLYSVPEQRLGEIVRFEIPSKANERAAKPSKLTKRTSGSSSVDTVDSKKTEMPGVVPTEEPTKPPPETSSANSADDDVRVDAGIEHNNPKDFSILDAPNKKRLDCLKHCQAGKKANEKLEDLFQKAKGDFPQFKKLLEESADFDTAAIRKLDFANDLADLTDDDEALVDVFLSHDKTNCLRDVALNLKKEELKALLGKTAKAEETEKKASELHDRLFRMAPTAVIERMARDNELEMEESAKKGLLTFFKANPELDFRKDSVLKVINQPDALKKIPENCREDVVHALKCCQRLASVCPNAEALPKLMKAGLGSAHAINEIPLERFVALHSETLGGEDVARRIHGRAEEISFRNVNALVGLRDAVLSPSVNMVHGGQSVDERKATAVQLVAKNDIPINYETLFGSVDLCECKHCNSVYSPAAYLVELFQYLRNNNLDPREEPESTDNPIVAIGGMNAVSGPGETPPKSDESLSQFTGKAGIKNTPLEKLFRRRPDLGHLQLTCENTNTLIPYIDLVNEVMESFVVNLKDYKQDTKRPREAKINPYNVEDESSGELLAEAQHTNYCAYEILRKSVYPACKLPYHQPIDVTRQYLNFLKTSRYELFSIFRKDVSFKPAVDASNDEKERLAKKEKLKIESVDRAIAAEYLHLTEEEYVILTKEGFHTKEWYEINQEASLTQSQYHHEIGLKATWHYYGIENENQMLAELKWVKPAQETKMLGFLRRVNLKYVDLVELLKTRYINPNYLSGHALVFMNSLPFSYRYLQNLVDESQTDIKLKYKKVVELLETNLAAYTFRFHKTYVACWVYKYFAHIGKLIILENALSSAATCKCIEGTISLYGGYSGEYLGTVFSFNFQKQLTISEDCLIYLKGSNPKILIGNLDRSTGKLILNLEKLFEQDMKSWPSDPEFREEALKEIFNFLNGSFNGKDGEIGKIDLTWDFAEDKLVLILYIKDKPFTCTDTTDHKETCDISKTQLKHLDGTDLSTSEYDRLHRFIRLWCKLGWNIAEVDQAIRGGGEIIKNPPYGLINFTTNQRFKAFDQPLPPKDDERSVDRLLANFSLNPGAASKKNTLAAKIFSTELNRNNRMAVAVPSPEPNPKPKPVDEKMIAREFRVMPEKDCNPESIPQIEQQITPYLIDQLVAIKKLQEITGLELAKLLVYWTPIGTQGENSLYERLFLKYNLIAKDPIFKDEAAFGTFLIHNPESDNKTIPRMSDHLPALMAALKVDVAMLEDIMAYAGIADQLTLENISHIYRHILLAKSIGLRISQLPMLFDLIKDQEHPFSQPTKTLSFYQLYERIDNSGFDSRQLNYIIRSVDDPNRPLQPETGKLFRLAIELRDALLQIEKDHADIKDDEEATEALLRGKLSLLYDGDVVEKIVNFVQGTTVYEDITRRKYSATMETSDSDAIIKFLREKRKEEEKEAGDYQTFLQKVQFSSARGVQVTGILSEDDKNRLRDLANYVAIGEQDKFLKAVEKLIAQPKVFFNDVLASVFPETERVQAENILLAQDTVDSEGSEVSAKQKRAYLLGRFLPYLREQLRQRQVVLILSSNLGLDQDLTLKLIKDVIKTDGDSSLYEEIIQLREQQDPIEANQDQPTKWDGFFVPEKEGLYTFLLEAEKKPTGEAKPSLTFNNRLAWSGPTREDDELIEFYESRPVLLKAGESYSFRLQGYDEDEEGKFIGLFLKFNDQPQIPISDKQLFPALRTKAFKEAYLRLHKAAMLLNGFGMKMAELAFFLDPEHAANFNGLDFNKLSFSQWLRMEAFYRLKKSLPAKQLSLVEFLRWANNPEEVESDTTLVMQINRLTGWQETNIEKLISVNYFNLAHPGHFRDEVNLLKLQETLKAEQKIGVGIDLLFQWGSPTSLFESNREIAGATREAIRARYNQTEWEEAIKPVHDQLRENQKQALIAYLLAQPVLLEWGVRDADSLFEFFLIDVQMNACMETSRIKQAISSVQLFVQRCFLDLEDKHGVSSELLDRQRWEWMSRYRVWEANRKVFLYPENWIRPELRDDKSPFFKELESELLQNDVNDEAIKAAFKKYLFQVNDVSNLEVVGHHTEEVDGGGKLHVFARTRDAPYFFYYRYFHYNQNQQYWYPWEKIEVDIPSINVENNEGRITSNGSFIIPVVWLNRLFIFFPQFMQKSWPNPWAGEQSISKSADNKINQMSPVSYWEIKMGWSEYKDGKWTPKQISNLAIYSEIVHEMKNGPDYYVYNNPGKFIFAPFVQSDRVKIKIYYQGEGIRPQPPGAFLSHLQFETSLEPVLFPEYFVFNGDSVYATAVPALPSTGVAGSYLGPHRLFHYSYNYQSGQYPTLSPLQAKDDLENPAYKSWPAITREANVSLIKLSTSMQYVFSHQHAKDFVRKIALGRLDTIFTDPIDLNNDNYGSNNSNQYHELKRPYAIYNWEAYFHSVALLADHLSKSQRFEEAMTWWHYIFDPINVKGNIWQVWKFLPFRLRAKDSKNILEKIFSNLGPNSSDISITEWRDNPFQPHVIARDRPTAYMKWVVMKYIDNLIAWGDSLFRQDTIESINQATQLYILAGHILGPRPEYIPKRGRTQPKSYMDLVNEWDAFSNAMVDLELIFPFSNQTATPTVGDGESHYINIYGFATTLYFCIPDNPKLLEYWDTVADRLFKIRHCLNIEGVFRKLNLFEPPIDPALLVQAAAQGLSIGSVLNDLSTPMPNYRFNYLLARALEVTSEVKSLGNALLSALEKKDGESLALLRSRHDSCIQTLVMEVRKKQLEEAEKTIESLLENRKAPAHKFKFYQKLVGEEESVPDIEVEFSIKDEALPEVKGESGMKLIGEEVEEIKKAKLSRDLQIGVSSVEILASILHAIPTFKVKASPFGLGTEVEYGGPFLGNLTQAVAKGLQIGVNVTSAQSGAAARKAGHLRQLHDRKFQSNLAGLEIKQIDKQITTQQIRIDLAQKEIENHQVQIDQTKEVEEFMRSKFSNEQLYHWMSEQLQNLYYQTYSFAYDLAKKAEKVYRFDMGLSTSDFVKFGYWNSGKEGFLAGEQLYLALKKLENAYIETKSHDYEITKHVSLRQVNPLALIQLKEQGVCEFNLVEELFDLDYPGQYKRRIKTVAVSIPCIVGPHTSLNCTLRLLKHEYRNSKIAANYAKNMEEADERFITNPIPTTAISVSHGQNDSGVFELSFQSERYLPFEGAGAISTWRLELSQDFRQFDYQTITDVVMHLRYTSSEGGDVMKAEAVKQLNNYVSKAEDLSKTEGLFRMFSLPHEFPNEWHRLFYPPPVAGNQILHLGNLIERFSFFVQSQQVKSAKIVEIRLFIPAPSESTGENLQISILRSDQIETLADSLVENFSSGTEVKNLQQYVITDFLADLNGFWGVQFGQNQEVVTKDQLSNAWMVVKYQLEMKEPKN